MANLFVPEALHSKITERHDELLAQSDSSYIPEWEGLVALLPEDERQEFLEQHGKELGAGDIINRDG